MGDSLQAKMGGWKGRMEPGKKKIIDEGKGREGFKRDGING